MAIAFLDTSAFMKLYLSERGSTWIRGFVVGKQVVISELALVEASTTLGRLYRDGIYTRRQASILYSQIYNERSKYSIFDLAATPLNKITSLALNLPVGLRLRALDGIHLVAAKSVQDSVSKHVPAVPTVFVSADVQLLRVAQAQGFTVENPENYP
jgi:predicted nucleic acid-binding protein